EVSLPAPVAAGNGHGNGNGNGHRAADYAVVATPAEVSMPWARPADLSILEQHTALMEEFLSTQEAVMVGYFGAMAGTPRPRPTAAQPRLAAATAAMIQSDAGIRPSRAS